MKKQEVVANYVAQLKEQGFTPKAAEVEAERLYESMYGDPIAAVEEAPKAATKPAAKGDA